MTADPLSVPPGLQGYAPGTPALPRVTRPARGDAGAAELTSVPDAYRWDGSGAAPPEIYALAVAIACLFGYAPSSLPAADSSGVAEFVGATYLALVDAGLSHDDIYGTIAALAPAGPQAIANALEQKIRKAGGGSKLKPCAPPAPAPSPPPTPTPPPTVAIVPNAPAPVVVPPPAPQAPPEAKKSVPWGWIIGGVGLLAAIGAGWWFATRKPKRKNPPAALLDVHPNPCGGCVETTGYEVRENPYSGTRGYSSVDPQMVEFDAELGMSPLFRHNPKGKRRRPKGRGGRR
jgi:hypothetical protein